jgi:hypothetical protein
MRLLMMICANDSNVEWVIARVNLGSLNNVVPM